MMSLELILNEKKLNNSVHDSIIRSISRDNEISHNVLTMFMNAYYKVGRFEGDIDLLQVLFDSSKYDVSDWRKVPVDDCCLLLYEVKSGYSKSGEAKAVSQLVKSKNLIREYSRYGNIDCFYGFGVGKGYSWRFMEGL